MVEVRRDVGAGEVMRALTNAGAWLFSPRGDGRERKLDAGPFDMEDADEVPVDRAAYLTPEEGKLRVYRCRTCEVRIAQEADLCRRAERDPEHPEWGTYGATFTRTFNLFHKDGMVACHRCHTQLFPYDPKDPTMLTLPLIWKGKRVFTKTALRATFVLSVPTGGVY